MSQVELCRFWCLLDGERAPFDAEAGLNWDVNQLTKAIRQEKRNLRALDTSEITLWKFNEPIPVDPEQSLLQRLPKHINDSSVKLNRTDKLSVVFPDRPENHLQILIILDVAPRPSAVDRPVTKEPRLERGLSEGGFGCTYSHTLDKDWSVFGAINRLVHYHVDPAAQAESKLCLDSIRREDFCLLTGSRASGKTSRLFWMRTQLDEAGDWNLYVSLHSLNLGDPTSFWESFGRALANTARRRGIPFPESTISSQSDFLDAFHVNKWSRKLILLLDELSVLYSASDYVRNQCLAALRELKNDREEYAVCSVLAAGIFSIVYLNPTDRSLSPFNVARSVQNPNFTLDETRILFSQFMETNGIFVEDDVIEDVWTRTGGHPGMVCLCGNTISQHLSSLQRNGTVSYQDWMEFPDSRLYEEISTYNTFRSMIQSLLRPQSQNAVRLLRSDFLGYSGDVTLSNYDEQCLADTLTAEGVLVKPDRLSPTYHMTSAFVDGLVRRQIIANLFPHAPESPPPLDESGRTLDFLRALVESLKCFDKELIRLASIRSYKSSKAAKVEGSRYAPVPRESVYDTELMRVLSNWLQRLHSWTVTGQWHLKNPFGKHKHTDIVLQKTETILLELVATADEAFLDLHIDKTPEYMRLLKAHRAWVIHFTRADDYDPVWQSDDMLHKGVNLVHIWHNAEFTTVRMIAKWKDNTGITRLYKQNLSL